MVNYNIVDANGQHHLTGFWVLELNCQKVIALEVHIVQS